MKQILRLSCTLLLLGAVLLSATAQDDRSKRPSPPAEVRGTINGADITITYSSPAVKGREIWGALVPYDVIWRTGANEATTFSTSKDILVNGGSLPSGRYALFTISGKEKWTVIFNAEPDQWGAFDYKKINDVLRVEATPTTGEFQERMQFMIEGDQVILAWENLRLPLKIE